MAAACAAGSRAIGWSVDCEFRIVALAIVHWRQVVDRELGRQLAGIQSPSMGKSGLDENLLCTGLLLLTSRAEMKSWFGDQQQAAFPPDVSGSKGRSTTVDIGADRK